MKRSIIFFTISIFISLALPAQQLASIYKSSVIKLVPDANYAKNVEWDKVFSDYNKTAGDRSNGVSTQIVVAPDGSAFMSRHTRHSILKFDKNGNFIKEFGKQGGKKACDFIYMPSVEGILDGKYVYTAAGDGRIHFFDLNGNWVKTVKLKYMPLESVPLKGGKIALLGHTDWKGNTLREIISILNFADNKEKIITSRVVSSGFEKQITIDPITYIDDNGKTIKGPKCICTFPFAAQIYSRARLATTTTGNLVAAYPGTGEVVIYTPNGQKIKQFKADVKPGVINKEDREEYYQKALEELKKMEEGLKSSTKIKDKDYWDKYITDYKSQLGKFLDPANYPANLPYFSEMIVDSENNILLFRFTREEGSNKFDVYTYNSTGAKIATTSFIADNYDLKINPSVFKFHNGSIYSFVKLKGATGNAMRLVKFNLKKD